MSGKLSKYFNTVDLKLIDSLDTPEKIQDFIDSEIEYDPYREDRSIKEVIKDRKAECYNGALFAVACLLNQGVKASIIEILAYEDEEHILCVYQKDGKWGAIAQSKYLGLKLRNPIYSTLRDLVVSYVEFFFNWDGSLSLDSYTNPLQLSKYQFKWINERKTVIEMENDLKNLKHTLLIERTDIKYYVSPERYWNETKFIPKGTKIPKRYLDKKPK